MSFDLKCLSTSKKQAVVNMTVMRTTKPQQKIRNEFLDLKNLRIEPSPTAMCKKWLNNDEISDLMKFAINNDSK